MPRLSASTLKEAHCVSLTLLGERASGERLLVQTVFSDDLPAENVLKAVTDLYARFEEEVPKPAPIEPEPKPVTTDPTGCARQEKRRAAQVHHAAELLMEASMNEDSSVPQQASPDHELEPVLLPPTLDTARAVIESMKRVQPECDNCEVKSYDAIYKDHVAQSETQSFSRSAADEMRALGWEHMCGRAGMIKRCAACATAQQYPWAEKLDPEKVLEHMKTKTGVWELAELEALV